MDKSAQAGEIRPRIRLAIDAKLVLVESAFSEVESEKDDLVDRARIVRFKGPTQTHHAIADRCTIPVLLCGPPMFVVFATQTSWSGLTSVSCRMCEQTFRPGRTFTKRIPSANRSTILLSQLFLQKSAPNVQGLSCVRRNYCAKHTQTRELSFRTARALCEITLTVDHGRMPCRMTEHQKRFPMVC